MKTTAVLAAGFALLTSCSGEPGAPIPPSEHGPGVTTARRIFLEELEDLREWLASNRESVEAAASLELSLLPTQFHSAVATESGTDVLAQDYELALAEFGFDEVTWLHTGIGRFSTILVAIKDPVPLCYADSQEATDALEWELSRAGISAIWDYHGLTHTPFVSSKEIPLGRELLSKDTLQCHVDSIRLPDD